MRREDWPEILMDHIEAAKTRPFSWGKMDCALFAADIVRALTGEDYAAEFRGRYSTSRGAATALTRYGKGTLRKTLEAKFGAPLPPLMARRGDLVMLKSPQAAGICIGDRAAFAGPDGITFRPLAECDCCWRID